MVTAWFGGTSFWGGATWYGVTTWCGVERRQQEMGVTLVLRHGMKDPCGVSMLSVGCLGVHGMW